MTPITALGSRYGIHGALGRSVKRAAAGDITITLAASCTDDLATGTYADDVQLIEVGDVSTLTSGKATVIADVTRAVA